MNCPVVFSVMIMVGLSQILTSGGGGGSSLGRAATLYVGHLQGQTLSVMNLPAGKAAYV
jgi:hypothetical protein